MISSCAASTSPRIELWATTGRARSPGKSAKVTPFMTGFLNLQENKFWGRPAYVLQMPDGALLVSDEQNGAIFRVSYRK